MQKMGIKYGWIEIINDKVVIALHYEYYYPKCYHFISIFNGWWEAQR